MGLFDSLKKIGEDISKEVEKGIGSDAFKNLKDAVAGSNVSNRNQTPKEIPAEYSEFPKFREVVTDLSTKQTDKYTRCTMSFPDATDHEISEYISKINSLGYVKGSNVRFDKGNTYIIVDEQYGGLNLVFHIKR